MIYNIERPDLKGKKPEEAIAILDTWAAKLTEQLNYITSHIEKENITIDIADKDYVDKKCNETYESIRKYIVGGA